MKQTLPRKLGRLAVNHTKEAFRNQGFTDKTFSPWQARKTRNRSDRNTQRKRAILVDKGHLRRSIRLREANFRRIRVGSYGIPYAKRHNRGLAGMPKRQFVGHSYRLTQKMRKVVRQDFKKAIKG